MRAIARAAYKHGAKFVDANYFDLYVKRERLLHAARHARLRPLLVLAAAARDRRAALRADRPERHDAPARARRRRRAARGARPAAVPARGRARSSTTARRTGRRSPARRAGGPSSCFPTSIPRPPRTSCGSRCSTCCGWTSRDPIAAWQVRADTLVEVAGRLTERRFDALHFEGPGTDLTVGLLPSSSWMAARFYTIDGIVHMPNLPSEEVFTTPDPTASTAPSARRSRRELNGSIIRGLEVRFENGRAVHFDAERTGTCSRATPSATRARAGSARWRCRRRGPHRPARHGLLRHAARRERGEPHRARLGVHVHGRRRGRPGPPNQSEIHVDFMIGSDDVRSPA